jgi:hypothetical protein
LSSLEERVAQIEKHGSIPAQHLRSWQLGAYLLIVVAALIGFIRVDEISDDNRKVAEEGQQAQVALCVQKDHLQDQVSETQDFLAHPEQFPSFNDPATIQIIQAGVKRDLRTIKTLDDALSCGTAAD